MFCDMVSLFLPKKEYERILQDVKFLAKAICGSYGVVNFAPMQHGRLKILLLCDFVSILCFSGYRDSWRHKIFHDVFSIKQEQAKNRVLLIMQRESIVCNIICGHMSLIIFRETVLTASDATSRGREAARLSTTCLFHAARGCHKLQIQEGRKKLVR